MNPFQHGEVYVTEDGAETDLDLGHYERFTNAVTLRQEKQLHHGPQVYHTVITEGAEGRLPGGHGSGHSAHYRRDQSR